MGMFDEIRCEYALPGTIPTFVDGNHWFQTKDLPDLALSKFVIGSNGTLERDEDLSGDESMCNFSGSVEFYTSNIVASGPGIYTRNGEDQESTDYTAIFSHGELESIIQTSYERKPALPVSMMRGMYDTPTESDKATCKTRQEESLIGRTMCVWYGGSTLLPKTVEVIAEGPKEWCVRYEDESLELISRWSRDRTFFDSKEDGQKHKDERSATWNAGKAKYDALLEERAKSESSS